MAVEKDIFSNGSLCQNFCRCFRMRFYRFLRFIVLICSKMNNSGVFKVEVITFTNYYLLATVDKRLG